MAITSESKPKFILRLRSAQFRYAMTYVILTSVVLIFLNFYSSRTSQKLFYNSKESSMIEKCQLTATEIGSLEVLSHGTVTKAIESMESLTVTRLIVTDKAGRCIYDSEEENICDNEYILFPEIVESLSTKDNLGYNVFRWSYQHGSMLSRAATPIISYGTVVGCVYMVEVDAKQGALIDTLQKTTLYVTLFLELAVFIFSLIYSQIYTKRMRKIMDSMRTIREGDYTHPVSIGGTDELAILGDEFNELIEKLKLSEQKRNNFVSDASHELKTPLASIKLLSDSILQNDMDIETVREFVADIGNEADRLNKMSHKLLSLTKNESQDEQEFEIVPISPTINRVVRMLSEIAKNNSVEIIVKADEYCPILIQEDDLYQIIFNLVENGIKYNIPGGTLTILLQRKNENAILTVQDTGMGIPGTALSHIFERFYRVDKARARKSGGSGLGLSIVKNMVERNGGHISVRSREKVGTTFTVAFPIFDTEDEV